MVSVINYEVKKNSNDKEFYSLIIQGGIEMVKSKATNQYYATVRTTSIPTTFDEQTCIAMIGEKIKGQIAKVKCEEYDYTNPDTGEVTKMTYRWEYVPEVHSSIPAFATAGMGRVAKVVH